MTTGRPRKEMNDNFSRLIEIKRIWFTIIKSSFIANYIIGRKVGMVEIQSLSRAALTYNEIYLALCHHPPLPSSKPLRNKFFYDKVTLSHTPSSSRVICERCREKVYQLLERSSLAPSIIYIFSRGENLGRIIDERRPQLEIDRSRERALQSSAKSMSSKCRVPP